MRRNSRSCISVFRLAWLIRLGVAFIPGLFMAAQAVSAPVNPTVANGVATFNQTGNGLTVTNSNSGIINWDRFSIAPGDVQRFIQSSASTSALNRVLNDPRAISGMVRSSDSIGLVNPIGMLVRSETASPGRADIYLVGTDVTGKQVTTIKGQPILASGATVSLVDVSTPGVKVEITGAKGAGTDLGVVLAEVARVGIGGGLFRNNDQPRVISVISEGGRIFVKAGEK